MKLSDEQYLFMKDLLLLLDFLINVKEYKITGGWLERNPQIQKILVEQGLSKTLKSNHLKKLAIDLNIFFEGSILTNIRKDRLTKKQSDILAEIGVFWENLNPKNRWGGNFKSLYDPGHFERNV